MALRTFGVSLGVMTIGFTAFLAAQSQTEPFRINMSPARATFPPLVESAQFTELVINTKGRQPTPVRTITVVAQSADGLGEKRFIPRIVVQLDGGKITIWADQLVANGDEFRFTGKVAMVTVTPGHF